MLSGVARQAGVQNSMFGVFHDAGYKGLYGRGRDAIKAKKGIPEKEEVLDRMDATELAANQFRMTQAREKIARVTHCNQEMAIETHHEVGRQVRAAIQKIGGRMPEDIPPAEHIKQVAKRVEAASQLVQLETKDAAGLLPSVGYDDL